MQGGGAERIAKQHEQGKLTARERIDKLADNGSFPEVGLFAAHRQTQFGMAGKELAADGVVTGSASVEGRLVHLASQDFTVAGGAAGEVHSEKVVEMMKMSLKTGSPFVFINDSGGARVQEGIDSLAGYAKVFYHNTMLSGVVPQISLICGPCAGGAAYSPALTDFIIQTKGAQMFITGPSGYQAGDGRSGDRRPARRTVGADGLFGRGALHRRERRARGADLQEAVELPAVEQPGRSAAGEHAGTARSGSSPERHHPRRSASSPTTCGR